MLEIYNNHNLFKESFALFCEVDPHLRTLASLKYQRWSTWWSALSLNEPGVYILTGGRQVGKSTSCKQLIKYCIENELFATENILYLPCDEIYDAHELSRIIRFFLQSIANKKFLLIIDEITYVKHWERVIKSLADEGHFTYGFCILTGSDSVILKEAAMSFPGRRGSSKEVDFHLYPLSFAEYIHLIHPDEILSSEKLLKNFRDYLVCGGYLRAINDYAAHGEISSATFLTYEQWIRGDFLRRGKKEDYLLNILCALFKIGVSPISYSSLTQKIGLISKETCIDYIHLLERMDVLFNLQAFDVNKKIGFPKKDRKFHFFDPFIQQTIYRWLIREGYISEITFEPALVEACVASHCYRNNKAYYFKGQGEIDVIWKKGETYQAIEVKWANQLRPTELKMLKQFKNSIILNKHPEHGIIENIQVIPVYDFLMG